MSDTPAAEDTVLVWAGPQHRRIAMTLPPFPFLPASPEERLRLTQYGELVRAMYEDDAERWRWLVKDAGNFDRSLWPEQRLTACPDGKPGCLVAHFAPLRKADWDAAIDAARSGGKGDGE